MNLVHHHGLVTDTPAGRSLGYRQALEWLRDTWGFPDHDRTEPYTPKVSSQCGQHRAELDSFFASDSSRTVKGVFFVISLHLQGQNKV